MSKPIKLTEELRKSALEEFANSLQKAKMADGEIVYRKNFTYKDSEKATVWFTPVAYAKMLGLIMHFSDEVAWHGVGERLEDASFLISDILVYPQTVTTVTVDMDTTEYAKWLIDNIDDDRFNHIIMQGHSHVMMGTSPSGTDLTHQQDILNQLSDDSFYIFMIWNKKLENNIKIFDLKNNTLYEDRDIEYGIYGDDTDIDAFIKEASGNVRKMTNYSRNYGAASGYNSKDPKSSKTADTKNSKNTKDETKEAKEMTSKLYGTIGGKYNDRGKQDAYDHADDYYQSSIYGYGYGY